LSIISRPGTTEGAGVAGAEEATRRDKKGRGKGQPLSQLFFERRELSLAPPSRQTDKRKGPVPSNPPTKGGKRDGEPTGPLFPLRGARGGYATKGILVHGARRRVTPSENPTLKNDHTQSDGDARLDRRKAISSLTRRVAHREGGSCKDGNEREGLNHLLLQRFTLCNGLVQENLPERDGATREGERKELSGFSISSFPRRPRPNNRSLTNHARGEGARGGNTYLHSLSLFDFFFVYPRLS